MLKDPRQFIGFLCLLAIVWIAVYWWWEPRSDPRLVFAPPMVEVDSVAVRGDAGPTEDVSVAPVEIEPVEPASELPVEAPEFVDYTVKRGDTLESIARAQLGHRRHAEAIARANPMSDLSRLREGRVIKIPVDPENIQGRPTVEVEPLPEDPWREYVVQSGDSLSRISSRMYGSAKYVDLIFEANRERLRLRSPDSIREGHTLMIPPKPSDP